MWKNAYFLVINSLVQASCSCSFIGCGYYIDSDMPQFMCVYTPREWICLLAKPIIDSWRTLPPQLLHGKHFRWMVHRMTVAPLSASFVDSVAEIRPNSSLTKRKHHFEVMLSWEYGMFTFRRRLGCRNSETQSPKPPVTSFPLFR